MTTEPTPLVTVTQADRDLATVLTGDEAMAYGMADMSDAVQAIARHGLAALEAAAKVAEEVARRAAAVADERNKRGDPVDTAIASEIVAEKIATAIRALSNKGGRDGE